MNGNSHKANKNSKSDNREEQLEELLMFQRVDQELNSTLNLENVLTLTLDWAMRRTGAAAGIMAVTTLDGGNLIPLVSLGYDPERIRKSIESPLPITQGVSGRAARTKKVQFVPDVAHDPDYIAMSEGIRCAIAAPIEMRGRVLGVISLEGDQEDSFSQADASFVKRLAARAAVALDNARLYQETERRANEMAALYGASRNISSSLERADVLRNAAQAVSDVLGVSSVVIMELRGDQDKVIVVQTYQVAASASTPVPDKLPADGAEIDVKMLPEVQSSIQQRRIAAVSSQDAAMSDGLRAFLNTYHYQSVLLMPLGVRDQRLGCILAAEGRRDRHFIRDDVMMAESLASQIAAALRQAKLYDDVRELESLKSEMIRMASHDLRNPLGNMMGYLELLVAETGEAYDDSQNEYVRQIRQALNTMKNLIEDLLTLEKIESERTAPLLDVNFSDLLDDVYIAQQFQAVRRGHQMNLAKPVEPIFVKGSSTQLRQALVNLIGNAVKYTPENGTIQVRLLRDSGKVRFEVQDNGYGISPERQERLFQRFYRARESGTEHITGTGLGLSLVKTVVERHGGEVWVKSIPGSGSTFGFWLPIATKVDAAE